MTDPERLEIRQAFATEGAELLDVMESALLALEHDPDAANDFSSLFRAVHTIKGSAGVVSFEEVEYFCHHIEHILVRIRERKLSLSVPLVALLLKCHDHIGAMMAHYCTGASARIDQALLPIHAFLLDALLAWGGAGQSEAPAYATLDESYFDRDPVAVDTGFHFFTDAVEPQTAPEQLPVTLSDASPAAGDKNTDNQRVVRVDAARIDQLSDLVVELVTAASVLEAQVRSLHDLAATESSGRVSDLIKQIQEKTMSFRMIPVRTLFNRFQRIIHDLGSKSGKQIQLHISGGETELDKAVAEKLHEPLLHLVRNAIDHGIETAAERALQGKPSAGTIHLQALHDAGTIVIRVGDDGQGINLERVHRKAIDLGLADKNSVPAVKELLACIFEPGFSTLDDATMLSGRGVGMDVVRKTVETLRGCIEVETDQGSGTSFQISIPLSLALVDGFMVSLGGTLYIMPMELVLETLELPPARLRAAMPNGCLQLREHLLPCLDLRKVLGDREDPPPVQHVVVFKHGGSGVGLIVDQLHGEIKTVIKPLGRLYRNASCISGAGILGDGSIALLLETGKLVETTQKALL